MNDEATVAAPNETREVFHDLDGSGESGSGESVPDLSGADHRRLAPLRIGGYRIIREIGRGGMGTIYQAEQERPRRTVALKVMRHGTASRSIQRRFEAESELLSRLEHPAIAKVYAAGTHVPVRGDGGIGPVPFFALEYVADGLPITEYAEAHDLSPLDRVELFTKVCDAVHHGHQQGVLHRDLKPANILVDGSGHPKVIDFGVARSLDARASGTTMRTEIGQLLGTVQYMSPEQVEADPSRIDARSDVYALGVVLYELLTGRLPYDVRDVPLHEATRIVKEKTPDRPSTVNVALRGDLETIVLKLLDKDPERRYASAAELKADLQRFLRHEVIRARPPSLFYQLRMFARRQRALFLALLALFTLLSSSLVVITSLYLDVQSALSAKETAERGESEQRSLVEQTRRDLERMRGLLSSMLPAGVSLLEESPGLLPGGDPHSSPAIPSAGSRVPGRPVSRGGEAADTVVATAFLDTAREALDRLEAETTDDPELRLFLAENYEILGDVIRSEQAGWDSNGDGAAQAYHRSLELAREAELLHEFRDLRATTASPRVVGVQFSSSSGTDSPRVLGGPGSSRGQVEPIPGGSRGPRFETDARTGTSERSALAGRLDSCEVRVLTKLGRHGELLACLEPILDQRRQAFAADRDNREVALELAATALQVGELKLQEGDPGGAHGTLREVVVVCAQLGESGATMEVRARRALEAIQGTGQPERIGEKTGDR